MKKINLRSDNEAPAHPAILEALIAANRGSSYAYGEDEYSKSLNKAFSEFFEKQVSVLPVVSGTAANALSLAQLTPPYGSVLCHDQAHIHVDECGAPEFFGGGFKLLPVDCDAGILSVQDTENRLTTFGFHGEHEPVLSTLSISQSTEFGTVYSLDEISELGEFKKRRDLALHMDGARFANALASLGCSPADMTWRRGVDMLSFGATKNGALMAEAVIIFDDKNFPGLPRRRMRGGHLLSKMRYVSAQLLAYIENNLCVALADHSNSMARTLASKLEDMGGRLEYPVMANEIFVNLSDERAAELGEHFEFHAWPGKPGLYRMVIPWDIEESALALVAGDS